jgi:hypothetical protein
LSVKKEKEIHSSFCVALQIAKVTVTVHEYLVHQYQRHCICMHRKKHCMCAYLCLYIPYGTF